MSAVAFADFFTSMMAFTHKLTFRAAWLTSTAAFKAIEVIKYAKKNAPNQANNFPKFSVMSLTENQLFGSSAGSNLQAIKLHNQYYYHNVVGGSCYLLHNPLGHVFAHPKIRICTCRNTRENHPST